MAKEEPVINQSDTAVLSALQKIFQDGVKNPDGSPVSTDDVKDIETIKLILSAILNDDTLESLTNLNEDELDDINDAFYLNEYFDNPRIDIFIMHRLKLSRSRVGTKGIVNNLLNIFADISGTSLKNNMMDNNTQSILGNRFKR